VYANPTPRRKNSPAKYRSQRKYGEAAKTKLILRGRSVATIAVRDLLP